MRNTSKILAALLFSVLGIYCRAQDHISDIKDYAPMYFNPALAGNEYFTRLSLGYKNFFPAAGTSYTNYGGMFDIYAPKIQSGFGLMFNSDRLGNKAFTYSTANIAYSYKINIGEYNSIRAGLAGNIFYGVRDPSQLTFPDMVGIDGTIAPNELAYDKLTQFGADFGTGLVFDSRKFEIGAAVSHLGKQNEKSNWYRPLKIYAHAEMKIPLFKTQRGQRISDSWSDIVRSSFVNPGLYYWKQGKTNLWAIGANVRINVIKFSLFSRQDFELKTQMSILGLGYASDVMAINYAFSMGFPGITFKGMQTSSHEICVTFRLPTNKDEY